MFKPGDIARLKSGGPIMTVERLIGDKNENNPLTTNLDQALRLKGYRNGDPVCQWFADTELKSAQFRVEALEPVAEE